MRSTLAAPKYVLLAFAVLISCAEFALANRESVIVLGFEQSGEVFYLTAENVSNMPVTFVYQVPESSNYELDRIIELPATLAPSERVAVYELEVLHEFDAFEPAPFVGEVPGSLEVDEKFVYSLPCSCDDACRVSQSTSGATHQGWSEHAVDFGLGIGSKVLAVRDGIVVEARDHSDQSCTEYSPECDLHLNLITTLSDDGGMVEYLHLNKDGARVAVGDTARKGELIGYSGNTGYSFGPHLHVAVIRATEKLEQVTVPMKFKTSEGVQLLNSGVVYQSAECVNEQHAKQ